MNLIIVESPTKAKTINKFLAGEYKIESSYGHIRDLPKSKLGIDTENDFEPQYVIPTKNRKRVNQLKKEAKEAEKVILATDEDREGEAIAWHLIQALDLDRRETQRIAFHEITESAVKTALQSPRPLDLNLVDAQQARRILDRLVGYKLSPFLWKKVAAGLSAGRVQSVALRLIAEREGEIRKFVAETYFTVAALLEDEAGNKLEAGLAKINGESLPDPGIKNEKEVEKIIEDLKKARFEVKKIEQKDLKRQPAAPFTTSTLEQEASKRLRFSAKQTMRFAQGLYEKGHITYMRTDSLNLSKESTALAKNWIKEHLGEKYAEEAPRFFKTKSRLAQEAHEAIRPTDLNLEPKNLAADEPEKKLYELIWRRFVASQLPKAVFAATRLEIAAENAKSKDVYLLAVSGSILKFDGFLKIWPTKFEDKELPVLERGQSLALLEAKSESHETEPPPRYNEASLIKILEENGIGRPSTYAPIISVIQERNYVLKNADRRFEPTEIGELVNKTLVEHFPEIVDTQFTAQMEKNLDEIAEGKEKWREVVKSFYRPFAQNLEKKYQEVEKQKIEEKTEEVCEKCGKPMVVKFSRFGKFLACSGYPECKNTKKIAGLNAITNEKGEVMACPECQGGKIVRKRTKRGGFFYGCSRYPDCKYASWTRPTNEPGSSA